MKPHSKSIDIAPGMAAKCNAPNQFENFDRLFRNLIAGPSKPY